MLSAPSAEPAGSGPIRYLIVCRRKRFDKRGKTDSQLVNEFAQDHSLDLSKIVHLGTTKTDNRVHIVFDYSNPGHDECSVFAFVLGPQAVNIRLSPEQMEFLEWRVDNWKQDQKGGTPFPIRSEVCHLALCLSKAIAYRSRDI